MKRIVCSLLAVMLFVFLSGCATTGQSATTSELQDRIDSLETRIQKVEKGQNQLEDMIVNQVSLKSEEVIIVEKTIITDPSKKDIQIALKNAGFYNGSVDGKIGPKTREVIMEFQKQNGLKVDGKVGKNTWEILGEFYE